MKIVKTTSIQEATYEKEVAYNIYHRMNYDKDLDGPVKAIDPIDFIDREEEIEALPLPRNTVLTPGTMYIFYINGTGKMIPLHITMKRKTIENLEKGSSRYGFQSIMKEALK